MESCVVKCILIEVMAQDVAKVMHVSMQTGADVLTAGDVLTQVH